MLNELGIAVGRNNPISNLFERTFPDILEIEYSSPSNFVDTLWKRYLDTKTNNPNINGKIFEYILACLCIRENILPVYLSAKVAFVPNVNFDLMFYTKERGPICWSIKTSLRERYKQADLEAIALKYVHRKALSFLITLGESEAQSVKKKIKSGDVIGIEDVIVANKDEFDNLILELKKLVFEEPPTIKVISSNQVVTKEKIIDYTNKSF